MFISIVKKVENESHSVQDFEDKVNNEIREIRQNGNEIFDIKYQILTDEFCNNIAHFAMIIYK